MLAYFEQNFKILKSSTLWVHFSMINAMLNVENNQDIIAVMGILGACRREELCQMSLNNIEDLGNTLVVNIPDSKTRVSRTFTVITETYIDLYHSGANLCTIKRHGGSKSSSVAEGYLEESLENKKRIACHILPNNCPSSNSEIEHINSISSTALSSTSTISSCEVASSQGIQY
ncbi:hypothetical protein NQ317_009844 [Molorchus minor]|uniref:Tyr recombinase domain-containing protein n=1 Tax=Molorchus minor TaxID=1323400 RepID=A0ABQ9K1W1_9CUCU|nr:hypothetical protein NQ317_009844 [Molorchus minor]